MSKEIKAKSLDFEKIIMTKVKTGQISMRPKWYFMFGSSLMIAGLAATSIGAVFLINLTMFLLRPHGPNGPWRLQQILESFPLWVPILAIAGIVFGLWMLKKYDFSYKKNFRLISLGFLITIILSAIIIDQLGLNEVWFKRGPGRRFYQQIEGRPFNSQRGTGRMSIEKSEGQNPQKQ